MEDRLDERLARRLIERAERVALVLERMRFAQYADLYQDPKRMFWLNFLGGVGRGLGIAVGFSLLGAVVLYVLQLAVVRNLPVIGGFIAELVRIVEVQLSP